MLCSAENAADHSKRVAFNTLLAEYLAEHWAEHAKDADCRMLCWQINKQTIGMNSRKTLFFMLCWQNIQQSIRQVIQKVFFFNNMPANYSEDHWAEEQSIQTEYSKMLFPIRCLMFYQQIIQQPMFFIVLLNAFSNNIFQMFCLMHFSIFYLQNIENNRLYESSVQCSAEWSACRAFETDSFEWFAQCSAVCSANTALKTMFFECSA